MTGRTRKEVEDWHYQKGKIIVGEKQIDAVKIPLFLYLKPMIIYKEIHNRSGNQGNRGFIHGKGFMHREGERNKWQVGGKENDQRRTRSVRGLGQSYTQSNAWDKLAYKEDEGPERFCPGEVEQTKDVEQDVVQSRTKVSYEY